MTDWFNKYLPTPTYLAVVEFGNGDSEPPFPLPCQFPSSPLRKGSLVAFPTLG